MTSSGYQTNAPCSLRWWAKTSWATEQGTLIGISTDGAEIAISRSIPAGTSVSLEVHGFGVGVREASVLSCSDHGGSHVVAVRLTDGSWPYAAFTTLISLAGATPTTQVSPTAAVVPPCFEKLGLSFPCTTDEVEAAYYERVRQVHPDKGGDVHAFMDLRGAFLRALEFLGDGD